MAFEQNQQDEFNLRTDAESLKRLEAELDKATTAIGAAEMAAEEKLAAFKLKNLYEQQKTRIKQLEALIKQEEDGIRKLANLRLTLSEKQFEVYKKELQKEIKLLRAAADEILRLEKEQAEKAEQPSKASTEKSKEVANGISTASPVILNKKDSKADSTELIKLVSNFGKTLGTLRDTVVSYSRKALGIDNTLSSNTKNSTQSDAFTKSNSTTASNNISNVASQTDIPTTIQLTKLISTVADSALDLVETSKQITEISIKEAKITEDITAVMGELSSVAKNFKKLVNELVGEDDDTKEANTNTADSQGPKKEKKVGAIVDSSKASNSELPEVQSILNSSLNLVQASDDVVIAFDAVTRAVNRATQAVVDAMHTTDSSLSEAKEPDNTTATTTKKNTDSAETAKDIVDASEGTKNTPGNNSSNNNSGNNNSTEGTTSQENKNGYTNNSAGMPKVDDKPHYTTQDIILLIDTLTSYRADKEKTEKDDLSAKEAAKEDGKIDFTAFSAKSFANTTDPLEYVNKVLSMDKLAGDEKEVAKFQAEKDRLLRERDLLLAERDSLIKEGKVEEAAKKGIEAAEKDKEAAEIQVPVKASQLMMDAAGELAKSTTEAVEAQQELDDLKKDGEVLFQAYRLAAQQEQDRAIINGLKESLINADKARAKAEALRDNLNGVRDKKRAQEKSDQDKKTAEAYAEYVTKAGNMAISFEEYKAAKDQELRDQIRKEASHNVIEGVTGIKDDLVHGKFDATKITELKASATKFVGDRSQKLQDSGLDEWQANLTASLELANQIQDDLMAALDGKIKELAEVQGAVDTRLQGSRDNKLKEFSYWKELLRDAKAIAGASPFMKQEDFVKNIKTLVEKGISFDIKQRAFLMTIQEKIANTFDVADGTLLRLIRIQQQDTTAGRLGMESALNSFLNSMYETSEYLESVAKSVRGSLEEMQALMEGKDATELEYQVQKWMGSLYSVGMSDSTVQEIARTFGQIASGDISGLSGGGAGNLLIMAANEAGMSIADILQDGLKADETNKLMQAMVNYLAEIAESSSDSKVVQQQLANVYGMKASDLRAATNLASSVKEVASVDKSYAGMMMRLNNMMNLIRFKTSTAEALTNLWDNALYSMASTQASNAMLFAIPKVAKLFKDVTGGEGSGGFALPFINVAGFGLDLNTTVSDLMTLASTMGPALGTLGPLITGLTDLANPLVGTAMLNRAGINSLPGGIRVIARGTASSLQNIGGASISESGSLVGNSDGESIKDQTMKDAEDDKDKQMVEAKEEETEDDIIREGQKALVDIYNLLLEVATGSQSLRVKVVNGCGCAGSNNGGGSAAGNPVIGNSAGVGTTSMVAGKTGTDNGNWVLVT